MLGQGVGDAGRYLSHATQINAAFVMPQTRGSLRRQLGHAPQRKPTGVRAEQAPDLRSDRYQTIESEAPAFVLR